MQAILRLVPHRALRTVDDVVGECMADIAKGKVVIIPSLQYKALTTAGRMVPRSLVQLLTRTVGQGRDRT